MARNEEIASPEMASAGASPGESRGSGEGWREGVLFQQKCLPNFFILLNALGGVGLTSLIVLVVTSAPSAARPPLTGAHA